MVATLGVVSSNVVEPMGCKSEDTKAAAAGVGVVGTLRVKPHTMSGACCEYTHTPDLKGSTYIGCTDSYVMKV